jgi:GGDEF domain-containing protein
MIRNLHAGRKQATDLFEATMDDLMRRTVAEEFQRTLDYSYVTPEGETVVAPTAEPVLMFRRAAFVHNVMEKAGYNEERKTFAENPSFIFLDLKDLFSANMAGAGDWLLSTAARTINDAAREYCTEIGKSGAYATCRYGGDEFMVGTSGLSSDEVKGLQQVIRDRLAGRTGYYLNAESGQVEERPIALNEEKNAVITVPEDPVERNIFLAYLNRGLILDGEQVGKVRGLFTKGGTFDEAGFEASATHTKGESNLDRKIAGILLGRRTFPCHDMADYIDRKEQAAKPAGKDPPPLGRARKSLNLLEAWCTTGFWARTSCLLRGCRASFGGGTSRRCCALTSNSSRKSMTCQVMSRATSRSRNCGNWWKPALTAPTNGITYSPGGAGRCLSHYARE